MGASFSLIHAFIILNLIQSYQEMLTCLGLSVMTKWTRPYEGSLSEYYQLAWIRKYIHLTVALQHETKPTGIQLNDAGNISLFCPKNRIKVFILWLLYWHDIILDIFSITYQLVTVFEGNSLLSGGRELCVNVTSHWVPI